MHSSRSIYSALHLLPHFQRTILNISNLTSLMAAASKVHKCLSPSLLKKIQGLNPPGLAKQSSSTISSLIVPEGPALNKLDPVEEFSRPERACVCVSAKAQAASTASSTQYTFIKGDRVKYVGSLQPELRGPQYGFNGRVLRAFEENGSSKIGVRFDRSIPEGDNLGGLCEEDHGFFCAAGSLRLESASSGEAERLAIDQLFQVSMEESKRCVLLLFLEVIEKFLLNKEACGAFMSKLESLPGSVTVVIIDWHTQMDNQKKKYNLGSSPFTKFGSNQTSILDAFRGSHGRMNDKSKETPETVKQITRLFSNEVLIQMPQVASLLSEWKHKLDLDVETLRSDSNLVTICSVLNKTATECPKLGVLCLKDESLNSESAEKVIGWALYHHLMHSSKDSVGDGKICLSIESIRYGVNILQDIANKTKNLKKSLKDVVTNIEFERRLLGKSIRPSDFGVTSDFIGALENVKDTLKESVMLPIQRPEPFCTGQLTKPCQGKLLFGHPGTRKNPSNVFGSSLARSSHSQVFSSVFGSSLARSFHAQAFSHSSGPNLLAHGSNNDENARVIYVKFLPLRMTKDVIQQLFKKFGTIKDVLKIGEILCNQNRGSYGYAFIEYLEEISADNAIQASGMMVYGRQIKIERRTSKRYSKGSDAQKPNFSDKREVYNEFVFSLPKLQPEQSFLHGKWPCNVINGDIVSLRGNHQNVGKKFRDKVKEFIENNFPEGHGGVMLWKAPGQKDPLDFWIHETLKHNVYKGRIFQSNYFDECVETCRPFLEESGEKSIAALVRMFKRNVEMERARFFKLGKLFKLELEAVRLFKEVANETYGVKVRITQKDDYIDLSFLQDSSKRFVDHVRPHPSGDLKNFHTFFYK